jgi:hypothetical protein
MIKTLLICVTSLLGIFGFSQNRDTLAHLRFAYGIQQYTIIHKQDTLIHTYRADYTLESIRSRKLQTYTRFYSNGAIMWKQEQKSGKAHGHMHFYDSSGIKLLTLFLQNDTIIDTLYQHPERYVLFGRFTYDSKLYGGMRRPNGGSNISTSKGSRNFQEMYLVRHDSTNQIQKYVSFFTDYRGFFFCEIEKGTYGIFPSYFKIQDVTKDMGTAQFRLGGGVRYSWNFTDPIKFSSPFCYLPLHYHSIGYAP